MPIKHSTIVVANTSTIKAADWNADHTIDTSIMFGTDVNLYRGGAGTLKTDSKFNALALGISGVEVVTSARVLSNLSGLASVGGTITDTQHGPRGSALHSDSHARSHDHSVAADGSPIAVAGVPNLDVGKITTGRFGMVRMPDGTSGYFLKAQGTGVDPVYAIVPTGGASSLSQLVIDVTKNWGGYGITNFGTLNIGADVNIYRGGANTLRTDDIFNIHSAGEYNNHLVFTNANYSWKTSSITYDYYTSPADTEGFWFKARGNTLLVINYNAAIIPTSLSVNNQLGNASSGYGFPFNRLYIGTIWFQRFSAGGTHVPDTNLYSSGANVLKTDDYISIAGMSDELAISYQRLNLTNKGDPTHWFQNTTISGDIREWLNTNIGFAIQAYGGSKVHEFLQTGYAWHAGTLSIGGLITSSNVLVSNLNADLLDGAHASDIVGGNFPFIWYGPSNAIKYSNDSEELFEAATYTVFKNFILNRFYPDGATIRVVFDLKAGVSGDQCYARVYKNGVAQGTERYRIVTTYQTYTEDLPYSRTDTIELRCKLGTYTLGGYIRNFRLCGDYHTTFDVYSTT